MMQKSQNYADVVCAWSQTAAATKETTCWVTPLPPPSACVAITKQCDDLVVRLDSMDGRKRKRNLSPSGSSTSEGEGGRSLWRRLNGTLSVCVCSSACLPGRTGCIFYHFWQGKDAASRFGNIPLSPPFEADILRHG